LKLNFLNFTENKFALQLNFFYLQIKLKINLNFQKI
jgi:hypothetical protein